MTPPLLLLETGPLDAQSTVLGAGSTLLGAGSTAFGAGSTVLGAGSTVFDAESAVLDAESAVFDGPFALQERPESENDETIIELIITDNDSESSKGGCYERDYDDEKAKGYEEGKIEWEGKVEMTEGGKGEEEVSENEEGNEEKGEEGEDDDDEKDEDDDVIDSRGGDDSDRVGKTDDISENTAKCSDSVGDKKVAENDEGESDNIAGEESRVSVMKRAFGTALKVQKVLFDLLFELENEDSETMNNNDKNNNQNDNDTTLSAKNNENSHENKESETIDNEMEKFTKIQLVEFLEFLSSKCSNFGQKIDRKKRNISFLSNFDFVEFFLFFLDIQVHFFS